MKIILKLQQSNIDTIYLKFLRKALFIPNSKNLKLVIQPKDSKWFFIVDPLIGKITSSENFDN